MLAYQTFARTWFSGTTCHCDILLPVHHHQESLDCPVPRNQPAQRLWPVKGGVKKERSLQVVGQPATTPGNFPGHTLLKVTHRRKTMSRRWRYFYCLHVIWPMGKVLPPIFSSFGRSTGWEFPGLTSFPGLDRRRPDLCEWWWDNHWSCFY